MCFAAASLDVRNTQVELLHMGHRYALPWFSVISHISPDNTHLIRFFSAAIFSAHLPYVICPAASIAHHECSSCSNLESKFCGNRLFTVLLIEVSTSLILPDAATARVCYVQWKLHCSECALQSYMDLKYKTVFIDIALPFLAD